MTTIYLLNGNTATFAAYTMQWNGCVRRFCENLLDFFFSFTYYFIFTFLCSICSFYVNVFFSHFISQRGCVFNFFSVKEIIVQYMNISYVSFAISTPFCHLFDGNFKILILTKNTLATKKLQFHIKCTSHILFYFIFIPFFVLFLSLLNCEFRRLFRLLPLNVFKYFFYCDFVLLFFFCLLRRWVFVYGSFLIQATSHGFSANFVNIKKKTLYKQGYWVRERGGTSVSMVCTLFCVLWTIDDTTFNSRYDDKRI